MLINGDLIEKDGPESTSTFMFCIDESPDSLPRSLSEEVDLDYLEDEKDGDVL